MGRALFYNFLSSLSVILGGLIAAAANVSNDIIGCVLAFGAGTYIWVASDCIFKKLIQPRRGKEYLAVAVLFVLGVMAIVVALLSGHAHCDAVTTSGHEGHNR